MISDVPRPPFRMTRGTIMMTGEPCLTLTTEQLAQRWGCHPETVKRAVRNGTSPVNPILPHGKWFFSRAAIERAEMATVLPLPANGDSSSASS